MAHRSGLGGAFEKLELEMFSVAGQKLSLCDGTTAVQDSIDKTRCTVNQ